MSIAEYIHMNWVYWALAIAYAITTLSVIAVILSENRNPVKSLAWVTVLFLFPAIGLILYLFFGRNIKNNNMSRKLKRRLNRNELHLGIHNPDNQKLSKENIQQIKLANSLTGALYYPGNNAIIYTNGKDKFNQLEQDLKNATKYIHLQYYIFEDDEIGTKIKNILIDKAQSGVKVKVIYDHVGSIHVKNRFYNEMKKAGIEIHPFFKVAFRAFATRINWRNHRKICIIDGKIGYIGGMNIADRYIKGVKYGIWRDCHMRIEGPAISALQMSFAIDWNFMGQPSFDEKTNPQISQDENPIGMQLITSGPTDTWHNIAFIFLKAIANAKKRIYIQTPYFLPTESLLKALQSAALSKIDVRIMLPRKSDSVILRHASASYIQECLNAGIKIYFYEAGMLHSKTMIIDDEFSTIGSTNFDFRSFEHNFECNMLMYSSYSNTTLSNIFYSDLKNCSRISIIKWRKRPITNKIAESIFRLLSPIL